jgi:hypothetical protein
VESGAEALRLTDTRHRLPFRDQEQRLRAL